MFKSSATVVNTLTQAGGDVDALDSNQMSPLHLASMWNPAVVLVLIGGGCKVNLLDRWQNSPLCYAAFWSEDRPAVAALMGAAANPHLGNPSPLTHPWVSDDMQDYIRSVSKWFDASLNYWKNVSLSPTMFYFSILFMLKSVFYPNDNDEQLWNLCKAEWRKTRRKNASFRWMSFVCEQTMSVNLLLPKDLLPELC